MENILNSFEEVCYRDPSIEGSSIHSHEAVATSAMFSILFEENLYSEMASVYQSLGSESCGEIVDIDFEGTDRDIRLVSETDGNASMVSLAAMFSAITIAQLISEDDELRALSQSSASFGEMYSKMTVEQKKVIRNRLMEELGDDVKFDAKTKTVVFVGAEEAETSPVYVRIGDYESLEIQ